MEILNLGTNGEEPVVPVKKKNKMLSSAVGISGVAAITGLGSTFAANISLNNDQAVEFGQGVTQTVACDSNGFTINPVTRYDNAHSKFRIDYVEITGIDLTEQGTGWSEAGLADQAAAIAAHPGQYYSGSAWVNTCDDVVLDFKAYTDSDSFTALTTGSSTATPLYWSQGDGTLGNSGNYNSSIAVLVNSRANEGGGYSNYGADGGSDRLYELVVWYNLNGVNSKIKIENYDNYYDASAQAINKFTVESMPEFPSAYYTYFDDNGSYYTGTY